MALSYNYPANCQCPGPLVSQAQINYLGDTAGAVDAANELVVAATVLVASVVSSLAGLYEARTMSIIEIFTLAAYPSSADVFKGTKNVLIKSRFS